MKTTEESIKWFEELLKVRNITFLVGTEQKVFNKNEYDFDRDILTRKVLYYDKTNNAISTHSPYGSHWEKRKDVVKLKADENFRWVINGEEYLSSSKFCHVRLESYNGYIENLGCFNENKVTESYHKLYESLKLIMEQANTTSKN